jgi:hypothetical protein
MIRDLAIHTNYWPALVPFYRYEVGNTTYRAKIAEQISKPPAIRGID